jgi:hypothetical protein
MEGGGKEACKDGRGAYLMNRVHIWATMLTKSSTVKMPVKTACRQDIKKSKSVAQTKTMRMRGNRTRQGGGHGRKINAYIALLSESVWCSSKPIDCENKSSFDRIIPPWQLIASEPRVQDESGAVTAENNATV